LATLAGEIMSRNRSPRARSHTESSNEDGVLESKNSPKAAALSPKSPKSPKSVQSPRRKSVIVGRENQDKAHQAESDKKYELITQFELKKFLIQNNYINLMTDDEKIKSLNSIAVSIDLDQLQKKEFVDALRALKLTTDEKIDEVERIKQEKMEDEIYLNILVANEALKILDPQSKYKGMNLDDSIDVKKILFSDDRKILNAFIQGLIQGPEFEGFQPVEVLNKRKALYGWIDSLTNPKKEREEIKFYLHR